MKIYTNQPAYLDFVTNEVNTLTYLTTRGLLAYYNDLNNAITVAQAEYATKLKKGNLTHFDFHAEFMMEVEKSFHTIIIGANVSADFQECSYFLAIVDKANEKLIRKFHFDYADVINPTHQRVPSYHLQYGGKKSPRMSDFDDSKLDHWLSLPRLNFQPVNLALLLDIALCEFRTEETKKIAEASEWRTMVYKNEVFFSKNYFANISSHIGSASYDQNKLIRDFCYGE